MAREIAEQTLLAERQLYRSSFAEFVKAAWHLVEHKHPLVWGWHLDLICKTLERAYRREIKRVIFNVPPRSLKSSLISVLFNAWVWATEDKPTEQFLTISHSRDLVVRDARKSRMVIQSPWFKRLFPHVKIVSDQNQKMYFETDRGGHRNAQSMKQGISGKGGNIITIDDPHDAKKILVSDADREYVSSTFEEAIESRLNNPDSDVIIIVMQRLHEGDLTGWVLKNRKHEGWTVVCLPLEFEPDHPNRCVFDKRTRAGECLLPGRWSAKTIDGFKRKPVIWNGQYQQRPSVRGGEIFQRKAWQVWTEKELPEIRYIIMSIDTAFKDGQDNDFSACTVWGLFINGDGDDNSSKKKTYDMILLHAWQEKLRYGPLRERVTMEHEKWDKRGLCPDITLIEDKASGQSLIQEMSDAGVPGLTPYNPHNEQAILRAHLASDILDDGAIWVPGRLMADGKRDKDILTVWAEMVVNQAEQFPRGENDDLVTTCFAGDTGIVTARGLVPIRDVKIGDLVLTHKGRLRKVTGTQSLVKPGAYRLKADLLEEVVVTGEHPAFAAEVGVNRKVRAEGWVPVSKLKPVATSMSKRGKKETRRNAHSALTLPRLREQSMTEIDISGWRICGATHPRATKYPDKLRLSYDLGWLLGFWMAEGCMGGSSKRKAKTRATWSQRDDRQHQRDLERRLTEVFGGYSKSVSNGIANTGIGYAGLMPLFEAMGLGASRKRVPWFAWGAPDEFVDGMIDGVVAGDGHVQENGIVRLCVTSKSLVWGLRAILATRGISSSICRVEKPSPKHNTQWALTWKMDAKRSGGMVAPTSLAYSVRVLEPIEGVIEVFNLQVDEDESYVTVGGTFHNCIQAWRYCREAGFVENSSDVEDDFGVRTDETRATIYG